jgi:opacity protein-like surface antigen
MRSFAIVSTVLALASAATADVVHADIWVTQIGGQLVTGGWDHETGTVVNPSQRVFEGELGADPSFPFSGDEPGIGSNLVGATLTMKLSPTLGAWNGAAFVFSTSALPASYGGQSASTGSGGSFNFLVTSGLDLHPEFTLSGPGTSDPSNGIYLATFEFSANGLATSEAFWVVFNLGMSEEEHEAAVEWVEMNLVPAPGALALLGAAGLMRRRRA